MVDREAMELMGVRRQALAMARRAGLRDAALRDEVAQEVLVRAWRCGVPQMDAPTRAAWLWTTARRCAVDALRRAARAGVAMDCDALPGAQALGTSEERVDARRGVAAVEARARALPPSLRVVFDAVVREGRAIGETARALGVSRAVVDTRLRRMRMRLAA